MTETHNQQTANKARLDNRWGCSVGHAFRNFSAPSRIDAHRRPSGATARRRRSWADEVPASIRPTVRAADPRLLALEIAEYNPEHDRHQVTLRFVVELVATPGTVQRAP